MQLPSKLENVLHFLAKIPGVGERTAFRQTLFLSRQEPSFLESFSKALDELGSILKCEKCGILSDETVCDVCRNEKRGNAKTLCVVENIKDCFAVERSGAYFGRYHITDGVLNPLLGIGPGELNIMNIKDRVSEEEIETVILAINPSVEGDATCSFISEMLPETVEVERIGFGIPMGGSLDHLDSMTISKALENKRRLS